MLSGSVIFYKIASMCLLIFIGFLAKRMKLLPENSLNVLSHFILMVATPCFILSYMPRTINPELIGQYWSYPLLGAGLAGFADLIGLGAARVLAEPRARPTFRLVSAIPNWVFLALAVCEPLFGEDGIRVVLLFNVGYTAYLWSLGVSGFRSAPGWTVVKELLLNYQILAAIAGFILAMAFPFLARLHGLPAAELAAMPGWLGGVAAVWEPVTLVGGTALPLAIFQIGLRLAGGSSRISVEELTEKPDNRALVLCSALRLAVIPVLTIGLLLVVMKLGFPMSYAEYIVAVIVCSMPTAVTCLSITDVFGGDSLLTARVVWWTTIASMLTVPAIALIADSAVKAV